MPHYAGAYCLSNACKKGVGAATIEVPSNTDREPGVPLPAAKKSVQLEDAGDEPPKCSQRGLIAGRCGCGHATPVVICAPCTVPSRVGRPSGAIPTEQHETLTLF